MYEQLSSAAEIVSLRRDLRRLAPGVAAVCGTESAVFRLLARAVHSPEADPVGNLRRLRLARFAVDQLSEEVQRQIVCWPADPAPLQTVLIVESDPAIGKAVARLAADAR